MRRQAVLSGLLSLLGGFAWAQQYDLRVVGLEDGLPSATVNAIAEDRWGHLWLATGEGVARTDLKQVTVFGVEQGMPDADITAIHAAGRSVWFGTRSGALGVITSGGTCTVLHQDREQGLVCAFADHGDTLYAAWRQGSIRRFTARREGAGTPLATPAWGSLRDLAWMPGQGLLAATDSGLFRWARTRWTPCEEVNAALPHRQVNDLYTDSLGLVVATLAGFLEVDGHLRPLPLADRFTGHHPIALPDARLNAVIRTRTGDLLLGTPSGLLHLFKEGGLPTLRQIREANGLGHELVRCLHEDRSGALWAGTAFGGLNRYNGDRFIHFTDRDGLGSRIVSAIHRTPDGLLWLGTLGGGVSAWDGHRLRTFGMGEGLEDPFVIAVGEDRHGHLLVGTATRGVYRYDGKRFTRYGQERTLHEARVFMIHLDGEERLWIATDRGLYVDPSDGLITRLDGWSGAVNAVECGGDTIWLATDQGLHVLPTRRLPWRLFPHPLVPAHLFTSVRRDAQGTLWLGTQDRGLFTLQGDRLDSLDTRGGLSANTVEQVVLDEVGNLWVGTRRGIDLLELDELRPIVLRVRHYGLQDGFVGTETFRNAALADADGALWFGTVRGATRFKPGLSGGSIPAPLLHFTGLRLFHEPADLSRWSTGTDADGMPTGLVLPHDRNHLTFLFNGISLARPERVRYTYQLEGHDPDWSPITTEERVVYSNLAPGTYTFRVRARSAGNTWTQEDLTFTFRIDPPFWATWSFRIGGGTAVALGLLAVVRLRERRLRRASERLERMVHERTSELATEKDRSERLLLNILPQATAEELKAHGKAQARRYEACTVLFSDFTGFTDFSARMDSDTLVAELDHFFRLFDRLCEQHAVEKIKTIGDAYMCAAGIPEPRATHALDMVRMALDMVAAVQQANTERRARGMQEWPIRIGIHSGPAVAGVVGDKKFAYDIWGDTVNLASRMESNSLPGRINISGATYALVMDHVDAEPRGPIHVKGKGELNMYFVKGWRHVHPGSEHSSPRTASAGVPSDS